MDYKKAYETLFNAITDALDSLDNEKVFSKETAKARQILIAAQQKTEDMYIES